MADAPLPFSVESSRFRSYPEYKDSGVEWLGEIPAHWEVAALRYRYEQSLGKMLDTKRITGDHLIPYLRNVDVQWDHINCLDLPSMDIRPHEIERYTVRPGDLLVCEGGEAGRSAIWRGELVTCGYQKALHRLRPLDRGRERPRFLYYTLAVAVTRRAFVDGQGSTIAHLTGDMLRAHRFPFPPTTEQHAIADFLDRETARINVQIAKQEGLIEVLQEKRTALISSAVTKGLNLDVAMKDFGVEWLGQIPVHWSVQRLKTLSAMQSGESITGNSIRSTGRYPVFGGNGLRGYTSDFTHDGNHILIGRQGAHCGNVHVARGRFWASEHAVVMSPEGTNVVEWCAALLEAMNLNRLSVAAAQPGLAVDRLRELRIPVPPVAEQHAIAAFLGRETSRINALAARVNQAMDRLNEYRMSLISAAVTGKIDVRHDRERTVPSDTPTARRRE